MLARHTERGEIPGAVALIARGGETHVAVAGEFRRDTIFRISSMTKLAKSVGSYGWDGGLGTSWFNDPAEGLTAILITQRMWTSPRPGAIIRDFWTSAYQAIDD